MSEVTGGESGDTAMAITLLESFLSISAVLAEFAWRCWSWNGFAFLIKCLRIGFEAGSYRSEYIRGVFRSSELQSHKVRMLDKRRSLSVRVLKCAGVQARYDSPSEGKKDTRTQHVHAKENKKIERDFNKSCLCPGLFKTTLWRPFIRATSGFMTGRWWMNGTVFHIWERAVGAAWPSGGGVMG